MNRKSITASAAVLLFLCAGPDEGYAQNGIVEMEFEYNETDYIECLGEEVEFNVTVVARGHLRTARRWPQVQEIPAAEIRQRRHRVMRVEHYEPYQFRCLGN